MKMVHRKVHPRTHLALDKKLRIPLTRIHIYTHHSLRTIDHGRRDLNALRTSFLDGSSIEVFDKDSSSMIDMCAFSL